ncbi:MAG: class I SAM-dependent methyltransferase [Anaerolineales bacterium]
MSKIPSIELLSSMHWEDYELLDTGNSLKLERFGQYKFVRPEHQAAWKPALSTKEWEKANAEFRPTNDESGGNWQFNRPIEPQWEMHYKDLAFMARTSNSRHLGVFPEQATHWDWIREQVSSHPKPVNVLNLFGYTGIASLAAVKAGANVTHLDASKKTVLYAKENQLLSGLGDKSIRWIIDDAVKFVMRESRRGVRYEGIILDPPKFGRGPKGEVWEFFKMLPYLLQEIRPVLATRPLFLVITAYAIRASALSLHYSIQEMMSSYTGTLSSGELVLNEKSAGRILSMAITSRWSALG